jgi:hypothetical protein
VVPDEKTGFYLRHWRQIEEWSALRDFAVEAVGTALHDAAPKLAAGVQGAARLVHLDDDEEAYPGFVLDRPDWQLDGVRIALELKWHYAELLTLDGDTWPYVGIHIHGAASARRAVARRLREELRSQATELQWDRSDNDWPWWRWVEPHDTSVDPCSLADDAVTALLAGWNALADPLDLLLPSVNTSSPPVRDR